MLMLAREVLSLYSISQARTTRYILPSRTSHTNRKYSTSAYCRTRTRIPRVSWAESNTKFYAMQYPQYPQYTQYTETAIYGNSNTLPSATNRQIHPSCSVLFCDGRIAEGVTCDSAIEILDSTPYPCPSAGSK